MMKVQHQIQDMFKDQLSQKLPNFATFDEVVVKDVYEEFTTKLCNTRIQEFVSATKQQLATKKGTASTVDVNLRTSLLTNHIKLTTKLGSTK